MGGFRHLCHLSMSPFRLARICRQFDPKLSAPLLSLCEWCAYGTDEAGIVPSVAQRLQELVSGLDGELAAMAPSPKQSVEVLFLKETKTQTERSRLKRHSCARAVMSPLFHAVTAHLVHSMALRPPGGRCCS